MQPEDSSPSERFRIWLERGDAGFHLRDAATEQRLDWNDVRIRVVKVAGVTYRGDALQDEGFAPGRPLELVAEPANEHDPNAIAVWDAECRLQAGYVPADLARELDARDWQALSLWEFREEGRRVGLRVLLAPRAAWIGRPRD